MKLEKKEVESREAIERGGGEEMRGAAAEHTSSPLSLEGEREKEIQSVPIFSSAPETERQSRGSDILGICGDK